MGLFHKKNQQKNKDPFIRLLTPMIAGFVACVFCLVSLTWAWFSASVDIATQTIEAAVRSTAVTVYEITKITDKNGNESQTKTPKMPVTEGVSLLENMGEEPQGVTIKEEPVVWELTPEKSYEVILTGDGTASKGYCKVALSHMVSGSSDTPETKLYKTPAFDQKASISFTYHTGGFAGEEGVTETSWNEYVNNTANPTLTIASFWGNPKEERAQVSLMAVEETEEYMVLSDGDVLGFAPIPCPEAKAEIEMDMEGFEVEEGTVISAAEDYQVALTLKEGYEMPAEVIVNIDGKDYVVSTSGVKANEKAPYYNAETGILTVPAALLHDGATVYLQATATPIPEEPEEEPEEETEEEPEAKLEEEIPEEILEETEEEPGEEAGEEPVEEIGGETEETETEESPAAEEPEESSVTEMPAKKEEDEDEEGKLSVKPVKTSSGGGGRDDNEADSETEEDAEDEENADSEGTEGDDPSDEDDALAEARNEKIDVAFTLAQLTIDLEKTNVPANADLVLTLAAKEGEEYPEQFVITLDKTVRDEENEDEEIEEDKTEYTINVDGEDNPEGFAFDAETGELTIESELLVGVRAISIAEKSEEVEETEEEATLPFEVKSLTFAFGDTEFTLEEDMVILFTSGEGYELPETIIITIDGEDYVIYTGEEDSEENPEGFTFDAETGTLTISKELLEDAESISIAAEAVKVEDDEENADSEGTEGDDPSDEDDALAEARNEKIDVTFILAQLTIDLERTNIPANADLVLTLTAKEGEEYPEQFVITLDKTIRGEENEEDKTEYTINVDGEGNPEGFAFDAETGELTIESALLVGVRTVSITDGEAEEEAILPFEVKSLTFAFGDTEFTPEEDMVILFTPGEGYELPETIIITIDGEEYVIYTGEEDSEENPEGFTFDAETDTLTISKEVLEDAESISIAAEAVEVEEEDSEEDESEEDDEENGDQDSDEEDNTTEDGSDAGDDDDTDTENGGNSSGSEGGDSTGTEEDTNENVGGDNQDTENGDTTEDENETEGGEDTGETDTETNPDDTTEGTENGTDAPAITNPEEEGTGNEQGGEGDGENGESSSGTENGSGDEPTTPSGDDNSATMPNAPEAGEPGSGGDNAESGNTESTGEGSGESTVPSSAGEAATLPSSGDTAQSGGNTSDVPAPASGTDSQPSESPSSDTTGSKEASSEEE